jgi:hypothetical protein
MCFADSWMPVWPCRVAALEFLFFPVHAALRNRDGQIRVDAGPPAGELRTEIAALPFQCFSYPVNAVVGHGAKQPTLEAGVDRERTR